jgi:hypothetical protein
MNAEDEDTTIRFVKKYWILGVLLCTLCGFGFHTGEALSTVQVELDDHNTEIKTILTTENTENETLASIQIQLAQQGQSLQDIRDTLNGAKQ